MRSDRAARERGYDRPVPSSPEGAARDLPPALHYVGVIRRQAWVIAATVAIVLAATAAVTLTSPSIHRTSMNIIVQGIASGSSPEPATQTVSGLLETDVLARRVVGRLHLRMTSQRLLDELEVTTRPESAVLTATFDDENAQTALAVLSELGRIFPGFVEETLGTRATSDRAAGAASIRASVFDPARVLPGRIAPRTTWNVLVGGALGLLLGLALAFARDLAGARPPGRRDADEAPVPVLATLAHPATVSVNGGNRGRYAELADVIGRLLDAHGTRVLLVPGSADDPAGDVWVGLALGVASSGRKTLAVAGDPNRSNATLRLGVQRAPGLTELLSVIEHGPERLDARVKVRSVISASRLGMRNLDVLPAGAEQRSLAPHLLGELLTVLEDSGYEAVIVQCADLGAGSARAWAAAAGGALVICNGDRTPPPGARGGVAGVVVLDDAPPPPA